MIKRPQRWSMVIVVATHICFSAAAHSSPGQHIQLQDGRHVFLDCRGQGSPTVIFEGGYAATSGAWWKVQPAIAEKTRACSYDRAGYGVSDPGPLPRDGRAVAADLDNVLQRANISGPFILVGHSAGALYLRLFAHLHPRDVVGMVLADPSIEYQDKRFAAQFGPGAGSLGPLRARAAICLSAAQQRALPSSDPKLSGCVEGNSAPVSPGAGGVEPWRTQVSELDSLWGTTSEEVARLKDSYGDTPIAVLTADGTYAGVSPKARAAVDSLWWQIHSEIAARSRHGTNTLVSGSSHMIMMDQPSAVIAAVLKIVSGWRLKSGTNAN